MARTLKIFLADLNYFNKFTLSTLYTPLNIGYIAVYLRELFGNQTQMSLSRSEWIDIKSLKVSDSVDAAFDVIAWRERKFKYGLDNDLFTKQKIGFTIDRAVKERIESFNRDFDTDPDNDYFYNAFEFIVPRTNLLYTLTYLMNK